MHCRTSIKENTHYSAPNKSLFITTAMKLQQGNVFTPVCHSVHRGVSATPLGRHPLGRHPPGQTPPVRHPPGQTPPGQAPPCPVHAGIPPAQCIWDTPPCPVHVGIHISPLCSACWDLVNKWVVHILLECILVYC